MSFEKIFTRLGIWNCFIFQTNQNSAWNKKSLSKKIFVKKNEKVLFPERCQFSDKKVLTWAIRAVSVYVFLHLGTSISIEYSRQISGQMNKREILLSGGIFTPPHAFNVYQISHAHQLVNAHQMNVSYWLVTVSY